MEQIKCRTCLKLSNKSDCIDIDSRCYCEQSIKQAILRLVPEMVLTIREGDVVCKKCLSILKICVKFVKTCLTVETILTHHNDKLFDIPSEGMNMEDLKVEIEEMKDILVHIDSDHNYYIKQEPTDCVNVNSKDEEEDKVNSGEIALDSSLMNGQGSYETGNCGTSSLQTLFGQPSLLIKNDTVDNIILEISGVPGGSNPLKAEISNITNVQKHYFVCSFCSLKFTESEKFELHMENHILTCRACGKIFFERTEYCNHLSEHRNNDKKMCEFCGKILNGTRSLRMHITAMHELSSPHICDKCPKSFKHKYKVNLHIKEVHEKARQQQCPVCGKVFINSERCKTHYKLVHLKLKPYLCIICGNKYGRKDYLDKHLADHYGIQKNGSKKPIKLPKHGIRLKDPGKPVFCKICNKEIGSVHLLKAHLENHVKIKRYKCKYCSLTFSVPTNQKRHEKIHEKDSENKFRCNICWKRMKTEEELEYHVNSHDKPPQYSCDKCGEKYHRRYLLKTHISEKHTSAEEIEKAVEEIVVKNLLEYADPMCK